MEVTTKEEALRAIAERAVELGLCRDVEETYQDFMERESQGPTGMRTALPSPTPAANP